MGDEQQCAGAGGPTILQMFGEPVNRHDIQMVGGLVQADAAEQRLDDLT